MTFTELASVCQRNGILLSATQIELLERYASLLLEANAVVNLISRKDQENVVEKHILHSLTIAMPEVTGFAFPAEAIVLDIGSGGGLPGVPLKIVRGDLSVTLCDSIAKKMAAVEKMIDSLGLKNIRVITGRAEGFAKQPEHRRMYDVLISRAVAPLDELAQWAKELVKPQGTLLSLKGGDLDQEIERTTRLPFVKEVVERPLAIQGYDGFLTDEKKVISVSYI